MKSHFLALSSGLSLASAAPPSNPPSKAAGSKLQWGPCESLNKTATAAYQCATLPVPLDYTDPGCKDKLRLNLIKVLASKTPSRGSLLVNPGGPGIASREDLVSASGVLVLGASDFDVITWDTRGTGSTLPANCYETSAEALNVSQSIPLPRNANLDELTKTWNALEAVSSACKKKLGVNGTLIGTAFSARDMLQIVDALGEDGMLRYYGASYGSQLGQVFAAMFPDKVDRMIIDGVFNPHQYIAGMDFQQAATADVALDNVFSQCEARPSICSLSNLDTSRESIRVQFHNLLNRLRKDGPDTSFKPALAADTLVSALYYSVKYPPFVGAADLLYAILSDDKKAYSEALTAGAPAAAAEPAFPGVTLNQFPEIQSAIECSDVVNRLPDPAADMENAKRYLAQSWFAGGLLLAQTHMPCMQWPFKAKEQYTGNFDVKTKNPILVVNNVYDPTTSLDAALNASSTFKGSGLLVQNAIGHTSSGTISACTAMHIKEYLINGTLPKPGTICNADVAMYFTQEELVAAAAALPKSLT